LKFSKEHRLPGEVADEVLSLRRREIGHDRLLPPVRRVEVGGRAVAVAVDEGRSPGAGVVAARRLDLDHGRAEVGERLAGEGTGQDAREVEDLEARKRCRHQKNA
jgi:hypothetical protein